MGRRQVAAHSETGRGRRSSAVTDYQRANALLWLAQGNEEVVHSTDVQNVLRTIPPTHAVRVRQTSEGVPVYRVTPAGQKWALAQLASSPAHGGTSANSRPSTQACGGDRRAGHRDAAGPPWHRLARRRLRASCPDALAGRRRSHEHRGEGREDGRPQHRSESSDAEAHPRRRLGHRAQLVVPSEFSRATLGLRDAGHGPGLQGDVPAE